MMIRVVLHDGNFITCIIDRTIRLTPGMGEGHEAGKPRSSRPHLAMDQVIDPAAYEPDPLTVRPETGISDD